jgi:hypothetical protein
VRALEQFGRSSDTTNRKRENKNMQFCQEEEAAAEALVYIRSPPEEEKVRRLLYIRAGVFPPLPWETGVGARTRKLHRVPLRSKRLVRVLRCTSRKRRTTFARPNFEELRSAAALPVSADILLNPVVVEAAERLKAFREAEEKRKTTEPIESSGSSNGSDSSGSSDSEGYCSETPPCLRPDPFGIAEVFDSIPFHHSVNF